MKAFGYFGIIVAEMVGCVGGGMGLGYLAWKKWAAPMWLPLLTGMAGLGLACYRIYLITLKEEK